MQKTFVLIILSLLLMAGCKISESEGELAPPVQEGLSPTECEEQGGRVFNTVGTDPCCGENEVNIGNVKGFAYQHLCCVKTEIAELTTEEIMEIAKASECGEKGNLTEEYMYNNCSKTWWIDLDMKEEFKKEYCNPACVVNKITQEAEINWRCMGALPPVE